METVNDIHSFMCDELEKASAHIDGIYVCPHDDGECDCRKPQIGLFLMAEKDFSIDKTCSWMVGDSESDIKAGKRYGIKTILTDRLQDAVATILQESIKENDT